jgi:hypothetical protein
MSRDHAKQGAFSLRMRVLYAVLAASFSALAIPSMALATEHHPTGAFAQFADCPLSNPETTYCVFAKTESGEVELGKQSVPITKEITLQGGFHQVLNEEGEIEKLEFIGAEDGNTLSKTPQVVPGGLLASVCALLPAPVKELCDADLSKGLTEVKATTELAAPATSIGLDNQNLIEEEGTALSLPVKIHLENTFFGSSCYIGSNAAPIVINFTTGTSGKDVGKVGKVELLENGYLVRITNNSLVNNTFSAPGAEGCDGLLSIVVDPVLNTVLGLPSGEGDNSAILNGRLETGKTTAVKESE